jgi:hypothetical protein
MPTRRDPLLPIRDVLAGAGFVWALQGLLRRPIRLHEAQALVRHRLGSRAADFLALAQRTIFANPSSPYRTLLRIAGCEAGDLEALVRRDGLEAALSTLYQRGVYLIVEELKGREPVVRGSATVELHPAQLLNPESAVHLLMASSGSRGQRRGIPIDLAYIRDVAVNGMLLQAARGSLGWARAIWSVPGGAALYYLIGYGVYGVYPERWFSQVHPSAPGLDPRYRLSGHALRLGALLAGVRMPSPRYVPVDGPLPIVRWMAGCLATGRTPHLDTFASSAARICLAAAETGIDLAGAHFQLSGEPLTEPLLAAIRRAGAEAVSNYGSMEAGSVGYSCLDPQAPDEAHVVTDLNALIQPGSENPDRRLPATALLVTSLRSAAPIILLNASMGDQAELTRRDCGCPLQRIRWDTHLHTIRSFEKLTAGGMTFLDVDVVRVLEEMLPARFGGGPTDYQLVEEGSDAGGSRLCLVIHPSVGPLDPKEVADAFLSMIGSDSGSTRVAELQWRQGGILRVERRPPVPTPSGKVLHLHQVRRSG